MIVSENKIEKPENVAESETYKIMPLIEPLPGGCQICINGERIEEVNNPKTGEKARLIVKNGDDVVSIDNYLNAKYLLKK